MRKISPWLQMNWEFGKVGLPKSAVSSVVEHHLDTVGVVGSNPTQRTTSARLWLAGGAAVSCIADFPRVFLEGGAFPAGRFLC